MILLWGRLLIRCSFSYITVIILRCCSLLCQVDKLAIKWSILVGTSLLHLPRSHLSGCASLALSVIIVLTSRSYGSTFWLCHFDFPCTTTVWLFPQSLSHGDTLFAASLADRKVCPFIIIFSPFFRFCRRTHKTFVRSHTHTRPPPKIGRPPNTRPKKDDDNPFTLFLFFFFALQPHTYIVCRVLRRDGTRIHLCTDTGLPKASRPSTRFSRVFTFNLGSAAASSR